MASDFGLQMSVEKTNGMAAGQEVDVIPVQVKGGSLDIVDHLSYLGFNISSNGEVMVEIGCRIGKASRDSGCFRRPIFQDRNLSVATKRQFYRAVVLSVLLYIWGRDLEKCMECFTLFHNRCVRTILGITRHQQWKERIFTMRSQQLKWLGHVGCMDEGRLPKRILRVFGKLKRRPCHGMKKRWRDFAKLNMEAIGVGDRWYELCQDRGDWFKLCCEGMESVRDQAEK